MALTLLHTADWHLGRRFQSFPREQEVRLTRARLEVVGRIFDLAQSRNVDAVLCAGDLFDSPAPDKEWWEGVLSEFQRRKWTRPVLLLPGNHDPLMPRSLYDPSHPFRAGLPDYVHVVDREGFEFAIEGQSRGDRQSVPLARGSERPGVVVAGARAGATNAYASVWFTVRPSTLTVTRRTSPSVAVSPRSAVSTTSPSATHMPSVKSSPTHRRLRYIPARPKQPTSVKPTPATSPWCSSRAIVPGARWWNASVWVYGAGGTRPVGPWRICASCVPTTTCAKPFCA